MSSQAERRTRLLEKMVRLRDTKLARRAFVDTIRLILEIYQFPKDNAETEPKDSETPDYYGLCSLSSLNLLFGPDSVPLSSRLDLRPTDNHLEHLSELLIENDLSLTVPSSAHEFIALLEGGALGAIIYSPGNEKSQIGHIAAVVPSWEVSSLEGDDRRECLVIDTAPPEGPRIVREEGLIDLYTSSYIGEGYRHTVVVITPMPTEAGNLGLLD